MSSILSLYAANLASNIPTPDNPKQNNAMQTYHERANLRCVKRLLHALLKEALLPYLHDGDHILIPLEESHGFLLLENTTVSTLNRFTFNGEILLFTQECAQPLFLDTPEELLRLIEPTLPTVDKKKWQHFVSELLNHKENDALSLWSNKLWNEVICEEAQKAKQPTLAQWLLQSEFQHESDLFFEQWIAEGHPYHPCAKTKLGLSAFESLKYSPEFHQETQVGIAAIHKDIIHIEKCHSQNYKDWFAHHFADIYNEWQQACFEARLSTEDYVPIPIHPWQEQHVVKQKFAKLLDENLLVLFSHIKLSCKPTLSFRTVIPSNTHLSPHIKLPVAVQTTSAVRTVSPNSAENGPKISAILQSILQQENYFNHSLTMMSEQFSLHLACDAEDDKRHLSCLYRENARKHIKENQLGIVVAALFEISPVSKLPLIVELMQIANATKSKQSIVEYFNEYARTTLQGFLTLYLRYGIALEGHQQNTLAVFEHGKVKHFITRDFGGVRIHLPTLIECGYPFIPYPNSATIVDDRNEARKKCLHTTYQYHLGELIYVLAKHFKLNESLLWQQVKNITNEIFVQQKNHLNPTSWQQDYQAILQDPWDFKALLQMRLKDTSHQYIYVKIPNPMTNQDNKS